MAAMANAETVLEILGQRRRAHAHRPGNSGVEAGQPDAAGGTPTVRNEMKHYLARHSSLAPQRLEPAHVLGLVTRWSPCWGAAYHRFRSEEALCQASRCLDLIQSLERVHGL